MTIIEDTRQKSGMHELKHQPLYQRRWMAEVRNRRMEAYYALPPSISVDTKADMAEIASNIGSDHKRFKRECIAARDAGCQLIILVENTDGIACVNDVHKWVNPELIYRPRAITGDRLQKAMLTMSERYGVRFEFCRPEESAKRIMELLGVSYE